MTHHEGRVLGREGLVAAVLLWTSVACAATPMAQSNRPERPDVQPGITVLLEDSLGLIGGRRIALVTNQTGVDARGNSDVDLLQRDPRAIRAGVRLVRLFSPEHGIRGELDRTNLPDEIDARSGLMVHSLYTRETMPPADSLVRDLDALVLDLQDIGTRTWTYVGVMVYSMRAAARVGIPFIVLDRPNPLSGRAEAPILDVTLANAADPTPERRGQAYALYPTPLRHGMTMGELARFFAAELNIAVDLKVVQMRGWRRSMHWEDTGLPWVVPSPAMISPTSALVYPALVAFEGTNVSVGRGTNLPFQRFGAPWMDAARVVDLLQDRTLSGVRFEAERFTPQDPGDNKYGGRSIPGVRIIIEERDRFQAGRVGAAVLWALARTAGDSLRVTARTWDLRFGSPAAREALMRGDDPDEIIDRMQADVVAFQRRVKPFLLY